ncbi:MAG: ABC transporter permease [Candidatus Magnetoovum sp. WYHC-5]|nr:ABC transporter permease [Candidatus Magnetoovum sp. WYHC-5]
MKQKLRLFYYLLRKDIKAKYAGSGFGVLWVILVPLIQILLFWFVFSAILRSRPYPTFQLPYVYFLLSAFFFWLAFSESLLRCSNVIIENGEVVKKIAFPVILLPITATVSTYIQHLLGFVIFMIVYTSTVSFDLLYLIVIPIVCFQLMLSIGLGLMVSALTPYIRDVSMFIGQAMQGVFFLSPVIYSLEAIPKEFQPLFYLNPLTYFAEAYHSVLLLKKPPVINFVVFIMVVSPIMLFLGYLVFKRLKEGFTDVL